MPGGIADVFKIVMFAAGTHTALAGDCFIVLPFILTHEHRLELYHPGIGEQPG